MTEGDQPEVVRGTLTFRNVHFAYPSRPEFKVSERNVVIWEHPHSQLNSTELNWFPQSDVTMSGTRAPTRVVWLQSLLLDVFSEAPSASVWKSCNE